MEQKFNVGDAVKYKGSVVQAYLPKGTTGVVAKVFDSTRLPWPYYIKWNAEVGCSEGSTLGNEDVSGLSPMAAHELELVKE